MSEQVITVPLSANVYSAKAALKAAHEMTDRYVVKVSEENGEIGVCLRTMEGSIDAGRAAGEFLNRVADHRLREILDRETEATRNVILANALSRVSFDERGN